MENLRLYRTIDFETFVDLMLYGEERYANPQRWDDTYEGYVFALMDTREGRAALVERLLAMYQDDERKMVDIFAALYSTYHGCYAQCWTATDESDAMWRIYHYGNHSVRIGTTVDKIQDALVQNQHKHGKIIKVEYGLQDGRDTIEQILQEMVAQNSTFYGFTHKREAFRHENEYRAMFMHDAVEAILQMFRRKRYYFENSKDAGSIQEIVMRLEKPFPLKSSARPHSATIKVDIENYLDSVMVHPFAEDWYVERVKRLCAFKGIENKFLGRSNLYQRPMPFLAGEKS